MKVRKKTYNVYLPPDPTDLNAADATSVTCDGQWTYAEENPHE